MKRRILKNHKRWLTALLILSLSMQSGCTKASEDNNVTEASIIESITPEKEDKELISLEQEIDRKKELIREYQNFYENYPIYYNFEEYMITPEEVEYLIEQDEKTPSCHVITGDYEGSLIEKIKNNSIQYLKDNKDCESAFITDKSDRELLYDQIVFEITLEEVMNTLFKTASNDFLEDKHTMQTLVIVYGDTQEVYDEDNEHLHILHLETDDSIVLGYYNDETNVIILSREFIRMSAEMDDYEFREVLYYTLNHEINHVRQTKCKCRIQEENKEEFVYTNIEETSHRDLSYNGDFITTLMESSAESEIYNLNKHYPFDKNIEHSYTYQPEREQEALLFMLALFNNKDVKDYYNAIYDTDLENLLEFFDMKTEEEQYDFFKILYLIDSINIRSNMIFEVYDKDEQDILTTDDFEMDLGYGYKSEIFKLTLDRLIEYTSLHQNFTLEDNLAIFNVIKNKVVDSSCIYVEDDSEEYTSYKNVYEDHFVKEVAEMEKTYISFLSEYYQISIEEIRKKEKLSIYLYLTALKDIVAGTEVTATSYEEKANKLLERFPMLSAILYPSYYNVSEYQDFSSKNNIQLIMK